MAVRDRAVANRQPISSTDFKSEKTKIHEHGREVDKTGQSRLLYNKGSETAQHKSIAVVKRASEPPWPVDDTAVVLSAELLALSHDAVNRTPAISI